MKKIIQEYFDTQQKIKEIVSKKIKKEMGIDVTIYECNSNNEYVCFGLFENAGYLIFKCMHLAKNQELIGKLLTKRPTEGRIHNIKVVDKEIHFQYEIYVEDIIYD